MLTTIVVVTLFIGRSLGKSGKDDSASSALDRLDERNGKGDVNREGFFATVLAIGAIIVAQSV